MTTMLQLLKTTYVRIICGEYNMIIVNKNVIDYYKDCY